MTKEMSIKVYITGATGYIGGVILEQLLRDNRFKITALVRSEEKAKLLRELGVSTVIGTLDDIDKTIENVSAADIVIEAANCQHFANAKAIVAGLEKKFKETGRKALYVHNSGSANVVNPSNMLIGDKDPQIYDDADEERIQSIPRTWLLRDIETYITEHSSFYNLVIVTPSLIYGQSSGLKGIANTSTIIIPLVIKGGIKAGFIANIGAGNNVWSTVHIDDVASFYIYLINGLVDGTIQTFGTKGYYYLENGETRIGDLNKSLAEIGSKRGLIQAEVKKGLPVDEIIKAYDIPSFFGPFLGVNSRVVATKARKLGWKPKHGVQDLYNSLEEEYNVILSRK